MDAAPRLPGAATAWPLPIKARTGTLSTDIRTPIGAMVHGPDLAGAEQVSHAVEAAVRTMPVPPMPWPGRRPCAAADCQSRGLRPGKARRPPKAASGPARVATEAEAAV